MRLVDRSSYQTAIIQGDRRAKEGRYVDEDSNGIGYTYMA